MITFKVTEIGAAVVVSALETSVNHETQRRKRGNGGVLGETMALGENSDGIVFANA